MNLSPLGTGPEFDKIRRIWQALGDRAAFGGDDCAIVQVGKETLAISTDMAIEGTHFQPGWLTHYELGWRAGAAALSDLAAVAAAPRGVLVSLGLSREWPDEFVTELMEGVGDVAQSVGAVIWGGDVVRSDRLVIDVTVVGSVERAVLRSGAAVGDTLWVTGSFGGPLMAIRAWESRREPERAARERFAHPEPRVAQALWLRDRGATALIDLSDGLLPDTGQLAAASRVQCVINQESIPKPPFTEDHATALLSGEEFELLVALPHDTAADVAAKFAQEFALAFTRIGHTESGSGVSLQLNGAPLELSMSMGYRHF